MANLIYTKAGLVYTGEMLYLKALLGIYFFIAGGFSFFMNTNEECLLLFLKNPGRIGKTTDELMHSLNLFSNPFKSEKSLRFDFPENKR